MTVRTDNLFIAHYQGSLLEEFHYYPFGMCFDVSKSPTLGKSAAIKYNSQLHEHDEFEDANGNVYGLEDYNFAFRNYDAQIGRWLQPDPLMQHPSPYLAMSNNPVSFTDPLGLWDDIRKINTTGDLYVNGQRVFWFDSESNSWVAEEAVIHAVDGGNHYPKFTGTFNQFGFPVVPGAAYGEKAANYQNNQLAWGKSLMEGEKSNFELKPASSYDYSQNVIPGKFTDDWKYITSGRNGNYLTRFYNILKRDWGKASASDKLEFAMSPIAFFRIGKFVSKIGDAHYTKNVLQNAAGGVKSFEKLVGRNPDVMFKNGRIFFTPSKSSPFYGKKPFDTGLDIFDYFQLK